MNDILYMFGDEGTPIVIRILILLLLLLVGSGVITGIITLYAISYWIPVAIFCVLYGAYKFCRWCEGLQ